MRTESIARRRLLGVVGVAMLLAAAAGSLRALAGPLPGGAARAASARQAAPRPGVRTGSAGSLTRVSATLTGAVKPPGRNTTYYFQYGRGTRYGSATAVHGAGSRRRHRDVSATIGGLAAATRYHFRLVATTCRGCRAGTRFGTDRAFTTAPPLPGIATGPPTTVAQASATLTGTVNPKGAPTSWSIQYGAGGGRYDAATPVRGAGRRNSRLAVAAPVRGLRPATTYHYRLVANNCGGCGLGTAYGHDRTVTTAAPPATPAAATPQQIAASRAVATYQAMQQFFSAASVYPGDTTGLYAPAYPNNGRHYSYLWPYTRVLAGTVTLAGIPPSLVGGTSYASDSAARIQALSQYWDAGPAGPGYDSYPVAPAGPGGDKYYDDQAWVGLALAEQYRFTGTAAALAGAEAVFNFNFPGGWDSNGSDLDPGGIYWAQQGTGTGQSNHQRATAANTPTAELGFLLGQLQPSSAGSFYPGASEIYNWVNHYLYNVPANPVDPAAPNPNFDASGPPLVVGPLDNGHVKESRWTYNQGEMVAASVAAYRSTGDPRFLTAAETLARAALSAFSENEYLTSQPAAFDAIYFRGLLQLCAVTADAGLRAQIIQAMQLYSDDVWNSYRTADGLFRLPSSSGTAAQLLDQGAMLQIYAALAWNPADYPKLP